MLSKEERKWFKKFKNNFEQEIKGDSSKQVINEIIELYKKQPEEIRRDIRRLFGKAFEKREDGNWAEDAYAALKLMGMEKVKLKKVK
ncbi:MAG: hypothetical protein KAJ44_04510 [Thermoplasmatales archaeon]|nr:hypothetical protein [Thermoplasmatales archaeon]